MKGNWLAHPRFEAPAIINVLGTVTPCLARNCWAASIARNEAYTEKWSWTIVLGQVRFHFIPLSWVHSKEHRYWKNFQQMFSMSKQLLNHHDDFYWMDHPKKRRRFLCTNQSSSSSNKWTLKRIGPLGTSWRSTATLPTPTATIAVNATKASCGWGIL